MEQTFRALDIPELVWKIFLDLSYKEILSLCKTSKQFSVYCRDPLLWAAKAKEDFDFPVRLFDHINITDPRQRYIQVRNYKSTPAKYLVELASTGDLGSVVWLTSQQGVETKHINDALQTAAANGHLSVVQWLAERVQRDRLTSAIQNASYNGHLPVVQWIAEQITSYNVGPFALANILAGALTNAVMSDQLHVVQWLADYIKVDRENILSAGLIIASVAGNLRMVRWLVEHGADSIQLALKSAIQARRTSVANYFRSLQQ